MDPAERAGSLHFKPLYQRAIVAAAGPLANFILAIAIFTLAFMISPSAPVEPPVIAEITSGSAAEAAGVQVGDVIETVDGIAVSRFPELQRLVTECFFSSRRRHTIFDCDWSSDVCSSD